MPGTACLFQHTDIDRLYGVAQCPIDQLPTTCTCGEPLTYADTVAFIHQVEAPVAHEGDPTVVVAEEKVVFSKLIDILSTRVSPPL